MHLGEYFTKELNKVEQVKVDDGVKVFGSLIVKFDVVEDLAKKTSTPIDIFVT